MIKIGMDAHTYHWHRCYSISEGYLSRRSSSWVPTMCSKGNIRATWAGNEHYHSKLPQTTTINNSSCETRSNQCIRFKCIPLSLPKARRRKAVSFKFLSSARSAARTLRIKLQEMRPPLKDELINWNPVWSWEYRSEVQRKMHFTCNIGFHALISWYLLNHEYLLLAFGFLDCMCPQHTQCQSWHLSDTQTHHQYHLYPFFGLLTLQLPPILQQLPPTQTERWHYLLVSTVHRPCS